MSRDDRSPTSKFLTPTHLLEGCPSEVADFSGERRLLLDLLLDAIECWQQIPVIRVAGNAQLAGLRHRLFREAHFWIFGRYSNPPFFAFAQTCELLGINPDFIRRRLLEWYRRRSAEFQHAEVASRCVGCISSHRPIGCQNSDRSLSPEAVERFQREILRAASRGAFTNSCED